LLVLQQVALQAAVLGPTASGGCVAAVALLLLLLLEACQNQG
jgi:hypothetical protein